MDAVGDLVFLLQSEVHGERVVVHVFVTLKLNHELCMDVRISIGVHLFKFNRELVVVVFLWVRLVGGLAEENGHLVRNLRLDGEFHAVVDL